MFQSSFAAASAAEAVILHAEKFTTAAFARFSSLKTALPSARFFSSSSTKNLTIYLTCLNDRVESSLVTDSVLSVAIGPAAANETLSSRFERYSHPVQQLQPRVG